MLFFLNFVLQSNEVNNSYAMELEGMKRALQWITEDKQLQIAEIVTDRHSSVKKYMREERPSIQHWFDVWHVAKGIQFLNSMSHLLEP